MHTRLTVKRFREWCQFNDMYDAKANSDVIDILGFLAYETVLRLTETALDIKQRWEKAEKEECKQSSRSSLQDRRYGHDEARARATTRGLFAMPQLQQQPVTAKHIKAAFHKLQQRRPRPFSAFQSGQHHLGHRHVLL
jgi:transcription initiation protein SPT3